MSIGWISADWSAPSSIIAGTTLRSGGCSAGAYASLNLGDHVADSPQSVARNRRRFIRDLDLPAEPAWLRQTHSTIVGVDQVPSDDCDAFVTRKPGSVCVILTADCLPVVLSATKGNELAVAHAGWRGLCGGILEATIDSMRSSAAELVAWLGPAISQSAFEVGPEVRAAFLEQDSDADAHFLENPRGRFQADLYGLARQRLNRAGIIDIGGGDFCTYSEPEHYFSYRRDGQCGRMATFAYMA